MVRLIPMTESEFDAFLARSIPRYATQNVEAGYWTESEALQKSRDDHLKLLPQGLASPHHYLFTIQSLDDAERVGAVWLSVKTNTARPAGFVFDLYIEERFRRKGYAFHAMQALEEKARALGLADLELHVFAHNSSARELYNKLGYAVTSLNLQKKL